MAIAGLIQQTFYCSLSSIALEAQFCSVLPGSNGFAHSRRFIEDFSITNLGIYEVISAKT